MFAGSALDSKSAGSKQYGRINPAMEMCFELDICPDLLLALVAAAGAAFFFFLYMAITVAGKRRRKRNIDDDDDDNANNFSALLHIGNRRLRIILNL